MDERGLPIISLFTGAMGMDLGLEQAGFEIRVAVECDRYAAATIRENHPSLPVIERKLQEVSTEEILEVAGLRPGEPFIVVGGPSCQAFSTAGQRSSFGDVQGRGNLYQAFLRVVVEAQPRFYLMENVRGMVSAAIRHRPLSQRGPGFPPLDPEEELGSAFERLLRDMHDAWYYTVFDVLNAADYGAPQTRHRLVFIGSRDGEDVKLPVPTHAIKPTAGLLPWVTLHDALVDLDDPKPVYKEFGERWKGYLKKIPEGGNWRNLPPEDWEGALGQAHVSWGGRSGFFRRLSWNEPAPSLTTEPASKATLQCHPDQLRSLSIAEYKRLQQFPDSWKVSGPVSQQYVQLGNALPVSVGRACGEAIMLAISAEADEARLGTLQTSHTFIERLRNRPRTIVNPPRMRQTKDAASLKAWDNEWLNGRTKARTNLPEFIIADAAGQVQAMPNAAIQLPLTVNS